MDMRVDHFADDYTVAATFFRALAHPGRLEVLDLLRRSAPRSVGELVEATGMERTAMSHQLRILRNARLVRTRREGRQVLYALADHHVAHIVQDALIHVGEDPTDEQEPEG
jgi:DNA-binding transcriptional ArsR family regulator